MNTLRVRIEVERDGRHFCTTAEVGTADRLDWYAGAYLLKKVQELIEVAVSETSKSGA